MGCKIGIRREDKNQWERRVPLAPQHIQILKEQHNIDTIIQPSSIRVFSEKEYENAGAIVQNDLSSCPIIFAIKEIPNDFFEPGKTYVFFSHTIKGQKHNMPMLRKMMDLGCTLIDYEKIIGRNSRRLIFFGKFAGLAGMIDTLWAFGQRMRWKGIKTPFAEIKQTIHYKDLVEAENHLKQIRKKIEQEGFPDLLTPLVVGFAGYGNVSKGSQEILDILPIKEIAPKQLEAIYEDFSDRVVYKVVFKEEHMVKPISIEKEFNLQEYYNHPHLYRSVFQQYIPQLTILMNCVYWDKMYPRLITKKFLKENYTCRSKLQVIGDISVDINGAIEFTNKVTTPDSPVFVYNHLSGETIGGYAGSGVVVLAVDNLPCELPRESSQAFSEVLRRFVPDIMNADFTIKDFDRVELPFEIKNAVILYRGKLTPSYNYINKYL